MHQHTIHFNLDKGGHPQEKSTSRDTDPVEKSNTSITANVLPMIQFVLHSKIQLDYTKVSTVVLSSIVDRNEMLEIPFGVRFKVSEYRKIIILMRSIAALFAPTYCLIIAFYRS